MCNAHEMAKEFAEENRLPEERVIEHQRKTITRQREKISELERKCDEWARTVKATSWLAALEAGALLILACLVLSLLE